MPPSLITVAESSGWRKTGRYDEIVSLCAAFEARYPGKVRAWNFGTTPEGRPLTALAASADGTLEPQAAKSRSRPVVLFQACIHAGESDGKDAGFWLLRDLLDGKLLPGILERVTAVFIPILNIDGHERFGTHNRPNQNGPEEMGWRVTAHNLNLNRDYVKAQSPEMAALLGLLSSWDPILYLDLHVTDGAKFEHDVAALLSPTRTGPESLKAAALEAQQWVFEKLTAQGHVPIVEFYPSLNKNDDPASGFSAEINPPRFSNGYWPLRNRLAVLVETHSWKGYAARVRATRDVIADFLELAARDGARWLAAAKAADDADKRGGGAEVPLVFESSGRFRLIDFRGYAYVREPSSISGQTWVRYDDSAPWIWKVPFYDELRPSLSVRLPAGGYLIPAAWAELAAEKLGLHGFSWRKLDSPQTLEVEVFRASAAAFSAEPMEGRQRVELTGAWSKESQLLPAGSLYVPSAQRGTRLLAHLLDPRGPDSLASWGFFNAVFEQKEYMEDYVAEAVARDMLAKDPKTKAEFESRLASDPDFAANPEARLSFFYQRHPSWDARKNLYPVYRIEQPL